VSAIGLMLNKMGMKKHIKELKRLVSKFGYWSDEVKEYNSLIIGEVSYNNYQIIQEEVKNV